MSKKPTRNEDAKDERSPEDAERIAAKTLKNLLNSPPKPFTKTAKNTLGKEKKSG